MSGRASLVLAVLPFALLAAIYLYGSAARHAENPDDKVMPTVGQLADGIWRAAFEADRKGEYRLWVDTKASLRRLAIGLGLAALVGLAVGLNIGVLPIARAATYPFLIFFAKIPPLALLPILFILFGVEEKAKIILIFVGVAPVIAIDMYLRAREIPYEQVVKALTLGASQPEVIYKVVLPQIFPKLLSAVRLSLGPAWLFLIAAESIAADVGLGYRIFVVRRYMAMDVIIPYVFWITFLGYLMDLALRLWMRWGFRWVGEGEK
ncbi:MAG: ABC transporter permease [Candidatus Schekmanbacteria bacterium]|nr:ABC transporter permease [Candidatus Schekmanbacteria bacterium]